jgi:hypothetical protein
VSDAGGLQNCVLRQPADNQTASEQGKTPPNQKPRTLEPQVHATMRNISATRRFFRYSCDSQGPCRMNQQTALLSYRVDVDEPDYSGPEALIVRLDLDLTFGIKKDIGEWD